MRKCMGAVIVATLVIAGQGWAQTSQGQDSEITPGRSVKALRDNAISLKEFAQTPRIRIASRRNRPPQVVQADRMMIEGRYEEARDLLYPMWKRDSASEQVGASLKRAYRGLKEYDGVRAVLVVQNRLKPNDPKILSELADVHFLLSESDSAIAILEEMTVSDPPDPVRFNLAARSYVRAGRYTKGIETYRRGRQILGDSLVFAEELGRLFEARREYASAVDEHFRWLESRPQIRVIAQKRITNLIKVAEAAPQITAALQKIVIASPGNEYAHRLYGDLLFESGMIDSAFAEYRRADALSTDVGVHQISGIERCLETQQYEAAREHARDFLDAYEKHPQMTRVNFALARAELGLDHPDVAVGMLKSLSSQIPVAAERARISYEIGEIYRAHTVNADSARVYFRRALARSGKGQLRTRSLARLGDIEVHFGRLELADSIYAAALKENPRPAEWEEISYRRAEILLFLKNYEECATALKKLVKDFPRGLFINDALDLSVLLSENQDAMNWSLVRYTGGLYAMRRGQIDTALVLLGQLVSDSANKIADRALFEIAEIQADRGEYETALADYRSLIARYPESFLVARSWVAIGELHEGPLADAEMARNAYQTVLTEYRDSPLVEEARLRLQRLSVPQ